MVVMKGEGEYGNSIVPSSHHIAPHHTYMKSHRVEKGRRDIVNTPFLDFIHSVILGHD